MFHPNRPDADFRYRVVLVAALVLCCTLVVSVAHAYSIDLVRDINTDISNSQINQIVDLDGDAVVFVYNPSSKNRPYEVWRLSGDSYQVERIGAYAGRIDTVKRVDRGVYFGVSYTAIGRSAPDELYFTNGSPDGTRRITTTGSKQNRDIRIGADGNAYLFSSNKLWRINPVRGALVLAQEFKSPRIEPKEWFTLGRYNYIFSRTTVRGRVQTRLYRGDLDSGIFVVVRDAAGRELACSPTNLPRVVLLNRAVIQCHPGVLHTLGTGSLVALATASYDGVATFHGIHRNRAIMTLSGSTALWQTDGTAADTATVGAVKPANAQPVYSSNDKVYFRARARLYAGNGVQQSLWRTTPATGETVEVTPLPGKDTPLQAIVYDDQLVFVRSDDTSGVELWATDGSVSGTRRLVDLVVGAQSASPRQLTLLNDGILFNAVNGYSLWRGHGRLDNGTFNATRIAQFNLWTGGSNPSNLVSVDNSLLFAAHGPNRVVGGNSGQFEAFAASEKLWRVRRGVISEIPWPYPIARTSKPDVLTVFNDQVHISSANGFATRLAALQLDGDDTSYRYLGLKLAPNSATHVTPIGNRLFISGLAPSGSGPNKTGREPFVIGPKYTGMLKDITPFKNPMTAVGEGSDPAQFTRLGLTDTVIFAATHIAGSQINSATQRISQLSGTGRELWKTDGSRGGTALLKDIRVGRIRSRDGSLVPRSSSPENLIAFKNHVYFTAYDDRFGRELWRTDGTPRGTRLVRDISPRVSSTKFGAFVVFNNSLMFAAGGGSTGVELWSTDGRSTRLLKDISRSRGSEPAHFTEYKGRLYFSAYDDKAGRELWVTDGTARGTQRVTDINRGVRNASPRHLTVFDKTLFFVANNGSTGFELYQYTDASGARLVRDLRPGAQSSDPQSLTVQGSTLYFTATDGQVGREVWRIRGINGPIAGGPGAVTRTAQWYAARPAAVSACLVANSGTVNVGFMTIKDELADDELDATRLSGLTRGDIDNDAESALELALGLLNADKQTYLSGTKRSKLIRQCYITGRHLFAAQCNATWLKAKPVGVIDIAASVTAVAKSCRPRSSDAAREQHGKVVLEHNIKAKAFNRSAAVAKWPEGRGDEPQAQVLTPSQWDDPTDRGD